MPKHFSAQCACHSPEYRSAVANAAGKRGRQTRQADVAGRRDAQTPIRQACIAFRDRLDIICPPIATEFVLLPPWVD
jgi:hypothetical protein